jgi:hypothetical protein
MHNFDILKLLVKFGSGMASSVLKISIYIFEFMFFNAEWKK